ncbi:uncharacterized protein [Dendrobates tinctorius]|uniref:uncharacterized protein n=1 Tax=Dendrobates tinctorius TaxID=92724 RepID=UPI003CC9B081
MKYNMSQENNVRITGIHGSVSELLPHKGTVVRIVKIGPVMNVQTTLGSEGVKQASERAHESDSEGVAIDVDLLIDMVRDREPPWNLADRFHADACVTRRLWEEVCQAVVSNWEELHSRAQKEQRERVQLWWRSMRDRFKKEFNKEMQAPSRSGCRSCYKYAQALSFLRSTMVTRSTFSSTREPALHPSGAIPQEAVTGDHDIPNPSAPSLPSLVCDPSAPSTSAGASVQASLHEAAVDEVGLPLPHPSDTAALYRTPLSSGRLRHRGQERQLATEFLHLHASFQNAMKVMTQQMSAGFNLVGIEVPDLRTRVERMHLDANKAPHPFFKAVIERLDNLTPEQQLHVMQACQVALAQVTSVAPTTGPVVAPGPVLPTPPVQYHFTQYQPPAPFQSPSPYQFPSY